MYGKIFDSIYDGTLYGHWEAIVTMQQLVVLADADGIVDMTPQAICARTSIPLKIIEAGLKKLADPDPYSRTPGEDGRRIVCMDEHRPWGWQIVNYLKYKHLKDASEVRAQASERVRRHREKRNAEKRDVTDVTHGNAEKRYTDIDTDTDTGKATPLPPKGRAFALPEWVPPEPWQAWLKARKSRSNTPEALTLAVKKLEQFRAGGVDPKAVLEQSIVNGWHGLFPLRGSGTTRAPGSNARAIAAEWARKKDADAEK